VNSGSDKSVDRRKSWKIAGACEPAAWQVSLAEFFANVWVEVSIGVLVLVSVGLTLVEFALAEIAQQPGRRCGLRVDSGERSDHRHFRGRIEPALPGGDLETPVLPHLLARYHRRGSRCSGSFEPGGPSGCCGCSACCARSAWYRGWPAISLRPSPRGARVHRGLRACWY
jgi:hypothetical protein